jgi:hypothetical protein
MKAKKNVTQKGKLPNPPPYETLASIESRNLALSKDEKFDALARIYKKSVDLAEGVTSETQLILMFLEQALDQDKPMELVVHKKDGEEIPYGHSGFAVAVILRGLSTGLFECWNEIDSARMHLPHEVFNYVTYMKDKHPKAASSR